MAEPSRKRSLTLDQFVGILEAKRVEAARDGNWDGFARLLKKGIETESTRIRSFCVLATLILERLFVAGQSDAEVHGFLVKELHLAPDKAAVVGLMAIDAGKKAVDVVQDGKSVGDAVLELVRDHKADPILAKSLVQAGVKFLGNAAPPLSGKLAGLALVGLICHPFVSFPLVVAVVLVLALVADWQWWAAALAGLGVFVVTRATGLLVRAAYRAARKNLSPATDGD